MSCVLNILLILSLFSVFFVCYVNGKSLVEPDPLNDMRIIKQCNQSFSVDVGWLNQVMINKQHTIGDESRKFNCFLHCLYNNYGFMNDDGGFDTDYMIRALNEIPLHKTLIESLVYKCTTVNSYDKCERALQFTICFWNESLLQDSPEEYMEHEHYYYNAK